MKKLIGMTILILCLTFMGWSVPVQAAPNSQGLDSLHQVSSKLEAEILQVIRRHPEVLVESLQAYERQRQEQVRQAQKSLSQKLIANPQSVIGESPVTGSIEGKIVLLEFSDFECPYCGLAHKTLQQFMATHQDRVTLQLASAAIEQDAQIAKLSGI